MIHLDLFSGIGGFSLAGDRVWGEDHHIHSFVEVDPFCQKVLNKHWAIVPIHGDIRSYKHNGTTIDLLTGGFPCQPFSQAGKRRGKEDDRYLWPEMLRVIQESKPTWIIGENVAGIVNLGLEQVLSDLESEGYEVQPIIIPACAVNAPHRRDRVWIIAHTKSTGTGSEGREIADEKRGTSKDWRESIRQDNRPISSSGFASTDYHVADSGRIGQTEPEQQTERSEQYNCAITNSESGETQSPEQGGFYAEPCGQDSDVTNSNGFNGNNARYDAGEISQHKKAKILGIEFDPNAVNKVLPGSEWPGSYEQGQAAHGSITECNIAWDEPWIEAATRLCRMDDGISRRMDRTKRLKALGNAIVPQVVVLIMESIKEINKIMEGE